MAEVRETGVEAGEAELTLRLDGDVEWPRLAGGLPLAAEVRQPSRIPAKGGQLGHQIVKVGR